MIGAFVADSFISEVYLSGKEKIKPNLCSRPCPGLAEDAEPVTDTTRSGRYKYGLREAKQSRNMKMEVRKHPIYLPYSMLHR